MVTDTCYHIKIARQGIQCSQISRQEARYLGDRPGVMTFKLYINKNAKLKNTSWQARNICTLMSILIYANTNNYGNFCKKIDLCMTGKKYTLMSIVFSNNTFNEK
jgi:hypothetical protein